MATGMTSDPLVGNKPHGKKAQDILNGLKNILKTGKFDGVELDSYDIQIVRALHDDLLRAIQGR